MDTSRIYDYLYELETRRSLINKPSANLSGAVEMAWGDYVHLIRRMSMGFEACVFQCVAENPQFKEELHVIANKLNWLKTIYENRKRDMPDVFDDSSRLVLMSATESLRFLKDNYGVGVDVAVQRVPEKTETGVANETPIISGTDGLAKYLGCGKSMAFSIIKNGVLKECGIQYMVGKSWKFNREKLEQYITEHPDLLAKIRCKK